MNGLWLTAALILAAAPARAGDVGPHIVFGSLAEKKPLLLSNSSGPGEILFESEPSEPISTPFGALLIQGAAERRGPLRVEASVKSDAGWGPWLGPVDREFDESGAFWFRFDVGGAKGGVVRLRAVSEAPQAGGWIRFDGIFAADAAEDSGGAAFPDLFAAPRPPALFSPLDLQVPFAPAPPEPAINRRSAWDARPATKPYEVMIPDGISVHHTETARPESSDGAAALLRSIQSFHQRGRGWIDIAYHFLIDGKGRIWEGRPLSGPYGVVGAHVHDKNDGNVGIALMGDFQPPHSMEPNAEQLEALTALAAWLSWRYRIDPDRILGHRQQESTDCPGDNLMAELDGVRDEVRRRAGPAAAGGFGR